MSVIFLNLISKFILHLKSEPQLKRKSLNHEKNSAWVEKNIQNKYILVVLVCV